MLHFTIRITKLDAVRAFNLGKKVLAKSQVSANGIKILVGNEEINWSEENNFLAFRARAIIVGVHYLMSSPKVIIKEEKDPKYCQNIIHSIIKEDYVPPVVYNKKIQYLTDEVLEDERREAVYRLVRWFRKGYSYIKKGKVVTVPPTICYRDSRLLTNPVIVDDRERRL